MLADAVACMSPHSSRIRRSWIRLLSRNTVCGQYKPLLMGLHLPARVRDVEFTDPCAYREQALRHGQDLARRGLPAECVISSIALYLECCLPHLRSADGNGIRRTSALTRWVSVYQFFLLSGYSQYQAAQRISLEEKIGLAERRVQDFSVELSDAYEKERRRLAQDLHDEIGHDLIVLKLYTQVIALDLKKGEIGQVRRKLKESVSLIKHALQSVRHLTFDLGPAIWSEQGFIPAVRLYGRQFAARTGLKVSVRSARLNVKLPASYETALYKILQGALSNIAAHADAQRAGITLESRREFVTMTVKDDGKGFNVVSKLNAPPKSYGLRAMSDRIALLGGSIQFSSSPARRRAPRRGTAIEVKLPLHGNTESKGHGMRDTTTVLLCDDHTLFREGIKAILRDEPSIEIIDEADNGREAVRKAQRLHPDVVLMDIAMPGLGGCEAASLILRANPKIKILILTMYEEEEVITRCLRAGAAGYVLKDAPRADLIHAINVVKKGGQYLSSRALKKMVNQHVRGSQYGKGGSSVKNGATDYERLSDREREVLKLLADGLALKEIATRLLLSVKTVDAHKTNMMRKLDLHDRSAVIKFAIQRKLIRLPSVKIGDSAAAARN